MNYSKWQREGSLQHAGENNIFLLKRAVCSQGQACPCPRGQMEAVQRSEAQASWISKSLFQNDTHIFRHEIGFLRFEHSYTLPRLEGTRCKLTWRWLYKMDGRNPSFFFHALALFPLPDWPRHPRWSLRFAEECLSFLAKTCVQGSSCSLKQNTFLQTSLAQR